jgi:hypothetical protein
LRQAGTDNTDWTLGERISSRQFYKIAEKGGQTGEDRYRHGQAMKAGQLAGRIIVADSVTK